MEKLPPVNLGAIILLFFAAAFVVRPFLERRFVTGVFLSVSQSGRQMILDMCLVLVAGLFASILGVVFFGMPLLSGVLLGIGYVAASFFVSVDMALYRERKVIHKALEQDSFLPPARFFSVTRKFSFVALSALLLNSVVVFLVVVKDIAWLGTVGQNLESIAFAQGSVGKDLMFIMAVFLFLAINMIWSYSKNMRLLFDNEIRVLESVSNGDLSKMAPVATNDEFGVIASHTNQMIRGLHHRRELLGELKLAEEVQQNLLPAAPPVIDGMDIAGTSIYCNETGGDYFDYIDLGENRVGLVMADASGHGVGAALHMATARSIFRTLAIKGGNPAAIVTALNRQLTMDTWETGRFMTLFYVAVNKDQGRLVWVRAGHDPAFLYDPASDRFEFLNGKGVALGLNQDWEYEENTFDGFGAGKVLVVATDGIWETVNKEGDMFGKTAVQEIIRKNADQSANTIMERILAQADQFRDDMSLKDDMTIIVAKA